MSFFKIKNNLNIYYYNILVNNKLNTKLPLLGYLNIKKIIKNYRSIFLPSINGAMIGEIDKRTLLTFIDDFHLRHRT